MDFLAYSDIGFGAFSFTDRKQEVISRKKEIVDTVIDYHSLSPRSLLFIGFNPAATCYAQRSVTVTQVSALCVEYFNKVAPSVACQDWDSVLASGEQYDAVIALDEFLTFAASDEQQHDLLEQICLLSKQLVITTLRDYKNQSFKDREFSTPSVVRNREEKALFVEYHDYDMNDRNAWNRSVYRLDDSGSQAWPNFVCRQMFFKQCAKFSIDAGAVEFLVHKNIMYKSLIKKNYEHVISIRFDPNGHNTIRR
jgi:hypothetical protein